MPRPAHWCCVVLAVALPTFGLAQTETPEPQPPEATPAEEPSGPRELTVIWTEAADNWIRVLDLSRAALTEESMVEIGERAQRVAELCGELQEVAPFGWKERIPIDRAVRMAQVQLYQVAEAGRIRIPAGLDDLVMRAHSQLVVVYDKFPPGMLGPEKLPAWESLPPRSR